MQVTCKRQSKAGAENDAKMWKTMQGMENGAKGRKQRKRVRKTMQKSEKRCRMQKTGRSTKDEAKWGAKSKHRGGQHALGLQQAKEAIKREKWRVNKIYALKWLSAICKYWTLATPASNVGRWQSWRPTPAADRRHAFLENYAI